MFFFCFFLFCLFTSQSRIPWFHFALFCFQSPATAALTPFYASPTFHNHDLYILCVAPLCIAAYGGNYSKQERIKMNLEADLLGL